MILDFWYFAIGHNGNSSCREGLHYALCQSSQTVKSIYILIKAILGPTLLIHTCLVPESWLFRVIFGDRVWHIYPQFALTCTVYYIKTSVSQGEMEYEIDGVYPAPSFFGLDVEDDGNVKIRVIRDLPSDSLQLSSYQVSLMKGNIRWVYAQPISSSNSLGSFVNSGLLI